MKKGQGLVIQAMNSTGQPISLAMPLTDFANAYDGPPTDPKVFEEQQKKLQEKIATARRRSAQEVGKPAGRAPVVGSAATGTRWEDAVVDC